jgi:hypothetical protein
MIFSASTKSTIEIEAWADVPEGRDRHEFARYLRELGNQVGHYDRENDRYKLIFDVAPIPEEG